MVRSALTIGHSTHPVGHLCELLKAHGVTEMIDVRSSPFSQRMPELNQHALEATLRSHGIEYLFLGIELGGRSKRASDYDDTGRVQYDRMAQADAFQQGIERVVRESESHRVALLCAERDPLDCHRTLLVGRALEALGVEIAHIHADGHLESSQDAMARLLDRLGMQDRTLFDSPDEVIARACARQAQRVAYVDPMLRKAAVT